MAESRSELLAWINAITQSGYTKVDQCGTGSAYCQIIDAMFGDVPMGKVKVGANQEYQYLNNYKVLQKSFKDHGIDKPIPVDRLVKCKMQDNLEFLQWLKKFWDLNWDGTPYDAAGRAGGQIIDQPVARAAGVRAISGRGATPQGARQAVASSRSGSGLAGRTAAAPSPAVQKELQNLQVQLQELTDHSLTLERERDFYFEKLRAVETLVQTRLTEAAGVSEEEKATLTKIQESLYSTEDGFEAPVEEGLDALAIEDDLQGEQLLDQSQDQEHEAARPDDEETF